MTERPLIPESALASALSQLAVEEADRLEADLQVDALPFPRQRVEEVCSGHQAEALRIIRRGTRPKGASVPRRLLPLAACLALVILGAFTTLNRPPAPDLPASPLATQAVVFNAALSVPEEWTGQYYPAWLPDGWSELRIESAANAQTAHYLAADGSALYAFTEHADPTAFQPHGQITHIRLDDQTAALLTASSTSVQLIWDTPDGRTLLITLQGADKEMAVRIARGVVKIHP